MKLTILILAFFGPVTWATVSDGSTPTREVKGRNPKSTAVLPPIPPPVLSMARWPEPSVLGGPKAVDPMSKDVLAAKRSSWEWIRQVLDPAWLPPKDSPMYFLRDDFDGRDVTRITWVHGEYRVEVSQTGFVFVMRLVPTRSDALGQRVADRSAAARELCWQVFNQQGRMWPEDGGREPTVVSDVRQRILESSFGDASFKQLTPEGTVVGGSSKYPVDEETPYWFHNLQWWNDGTSVGFYFLMVEWGGPYPTPHSYGKRGDGSWFDRPKD